MSDDGMWDTKPEKPWDEPENPEPKLSAIRVISVVILIAAFLIFMGMPNYDPISFAFVPAIFSSFAIIDGLCNMELVRSLKGKG